MRGTMDDDGSITARHGEAVRWIERLGLEAHPEGGFFRETYRSAASLGPCCLGAGYTDRRSVSTAIYFLLRGDQASRFHRIRSDEVWHHYAGGGLTLHLLLDPAAAAAMGDGGTDGYRSLRLGSDPAGGALPQAVVPAGAWFGATVDDAAAFALVGCTVAPGFDFRDFEMARREDLLRSHPRHGELIVRLTPGEGSAVR